MKQYLDLLDNILTKGTVKKDRTGIGTISIFGTDLRFNLQEGFPLVTTKRLYYKGILHELLWFLGNHMKDPKYNRLSMTNIKYLVDNDVNIWNEWPYDKFCKTYHPNIVKYSDEWKQTLELFKEDIKNNFEFAKEHGNLGPVYGKQWVNFEGLRKGILTSVNQIDIVINTLKTNPDSRRIMLNAWNPVEIPDMALDPCHYGFQCISVEMNDDEKNKYLDGLPIDEHFKFPRKLSLKFNMRSIDTFFGLPFNIASYAYLTHMLAEQTHHIVDELIFSGGDTHIYLNLVDQVKEQLKRTPYELPKILMNKNVSSIYDYKYEDFEIQDYKYHPAIKGQIAV